MRVFPGSFPPAVFDDLPLDRYAEFYGLAVTFLEEETAALAAMRGDDG